MTDFDPMAAAGDAIRAEFERKDARIAELREALEPLVENAERVEHDYYGLQSHEHFDVEAALRKARAALNQEMDRG